MNEERISFRFVAHSCIMVRRKNTKKNSCEWPCGACKKNCLDSCLFCAVCEKWFHNACENVSTENLKLLSDNPEEYICSSCRNENGKFDFLMGMERLKRVGCIDFIYTCSDLLLLFIFFFNNL
jgi:hypothetical protein